MSALEKITDWLKLGNKIMIPKTYASCVYDANGQTVEARLKALQSQIDTGGSSIKTSENVTYGGTGVGGLATYHDLQAAPVQTAE